MTNPKTDIFGICTALGEDIGVPADVFRIAFAIVLFLDLRIAIAAYALTGAIVFATRWLVPEPRIATTDATRAPAPEALRQAA